MSGPISVINRLIFKSPPKAIGPDKLLTYDIDTKEVSYIPIDELTIDIEIEDVNGLQEVLDSKLDKVDYNDRFKGKYISEEALVLSVPISAPGDYAIVDAGAGENSLQYIWDDEEGWILSGEVSPETTDDLLEGTNNLYFTAARVLSTALSGLSILTGGPIINTDTVLGAFGKTQKQINDLITSIGLKLDKGGYTGTAQTLADAIDAIFVPDQLISAVPPTRSVNTFTYPALGYSALLSKTLRTNPSQFITTITAASTTNHKRVDLIYFKPDNTLSKFIGTEDLIIAPRPDVPVGSVGVSFINVFGNVIDDPTPITNEISIQNFLGVELFKITNYMRFQNVSFDIAAKAIIIDPLLTLAVYLDIVNGDDSTALLENANKPFKTWDAMINKLPTFNGETYTIYFVSGGIVNIIRRITPRPFNFVAYQPVSLDFTNCKEINGTTDASFVLNAGTDQIWTFMNENISIKCDITNGGKTFATNGNTSRIILRGTINELRWNTTNSVAFTFSQTTEITFNKIYESTSATTLFLGNIGKSKLRMREYIVTIGYLLCAEVDLDLVIDKITHTGSGTINWLTNQISAGVRYNLTDINVRGTVTFKANELIVNGTLGPTTQINFDGTAIVSGNIKSTLYNVITYNSRGTTFRNFTGKLSNLDLYTLTDLVFENCNIETNIILFNQTYVQQAIPYVKFLGFNTIKQNGTGDLFAGGTSVKNILVDINGEIKTNAKSFGKFVKVKYTSATFKEKDKEIIIKNKLDLINRVLDPLNCYVVDGDLLLVAGEFIIWPAGGLTLDGYGFKPSRIRKNVIGESIFKSALGGSGDFVSNKIEYESGLGMVFDVQDIDGTHAIEINDVNFQNCFSLGKIKGYRQGTGLTIGIYGCSDGFILSGNIDGFSLSKLHVRTFAATGTLFKKDVDTNFANRFLLDSPNISGVTGIKLCDFDSSIFSADESFQITNGVFKVNGIIDESNTSALIPNINPNDAKSRWTNSTGIKLTALKFFDMKSPDGNIWRIEVSNAGVLTVTDL